MAPGDESSDSPSSSSGTFDKPVNPNPNESFESELWHLLRAELDQAFAPETTQWLEVGPQLHAAAPLWPVPELFDVDEQWTRQDHNPDDSGPFNAESWTYHPDLLPSAPLIDKADVLGVPRMLDAGRFGDANDGFGRGPFSARYEPPPSERRCLLCGGRDFKYPKDIRRHWKSAHTSDRPHKCPIVVCEFHVVGFPRKDNWKRHMSTKHPGHCSGIPWMNPA